MKLLPGDQEDLPIGWHGYCRCLIGSDKEWYQCVVISECNVAVLIGASWTIKSRTINKLEFRPLQSEAYINGWFERGELPPVGIECEALYSGEWVKCKVIAMANNNILGKTDAVYQLDRDWSFENDPASFRPLKSDRDKAVEAACEVLQCKPGSIVGEYAAKLVDAGWRLPEGEMR